MEGQDTNQILHDFSPRFRVYKDGRVERLGENILVPPSFDPDTGVHSKDVAISDCISCRIFMPDNIPQHTRLPLLIYFHGGAFCRYSPSSSVYHSYLNSLVSEARVIAVSADYRLAPEHPIPACYDDSWTITEWVVSHSGGSGPDPWLNQWADFGYVFMAGDSAGGNIAHAITARAGPGELLGPGVRLSGIALVHPFFGDGEPDKLWEFLCEGKLGWEDPRLNPAADPARMRREIGCERVLVCVDEEDELKGRGVRYYEALKESGWEGELELVKTNGGDHVFHLFEPEHEKAKDFLKVIACFINKST